MSLKLGDEVTVLSNRRRFLEKNSIAWDHHVCMRCDHGTTILTIDHRTPVDQYRMIDAEVLVTTDPACTLMLLTADCLPVVFFDHVKHVLALAHFSRQTIAAGLPEQTVIFLKDRFGIDPTNLTITVGPHIRSVSYRFPLPLETRPVAIAPFITARDGYAYIDLTTAAIAQLTKSGVSTDAITIDPANTGADDRYFSYYRAKHEQRADGRIATLAKILTK